MYDYAKSYVFIAFKEHPSNLKMEAREFVDISQPVWQIILKHVAEVTIFIRTAMITLHFYTNSKWLVTERKSVLIMLYLQESLKNLKKNNKQKQQK